MYFTIEMIKAIEYDFEMNNIEGSLYRIFKLSKQYSVEDDLRWTQSVYFIDNTQSEYIDLTKSSSSQLKLYSNSDVLRFLAEADEVKVIGLNIISPDYKNNDLSKEFTNIILKRISLHETNKRDQALKMVIDMDISELGDALHWRRPKME